MTLDTVTLERTVRLALDEDLGSAGDVTSDSVIDETASAEAAFVARQGLVVAGLPVVRAVYRVLDGTLAFHPLVADGEQVAAGAVVARVAGNARAILRGERTALNFLMRLCGIATAARAAVEEVAGTGAVILDTRKTAPGLRMLDKYAVAAGGAVNHRMGLFDAVMIKDTHLRAGASISAGVARALRRGHPPAAITVEVRDLDQLTEAIRAGAGRALLDNMEPETIARAVKLAAGRVVLEASGGLRPGRLRQVAATGVDCLSLGWLTHSAPAADLAMEVETAD
jgi:nicotinate-nucleotide pyrophosphorylase (carboxylating)